MMPLISGARRALFTLFLLALGAGAALAAETRVALVVGNGAYRGSPLANPVHDAEAMAQALREAGFQVQLLADADHRRMLAALRDFGDRLRKAQVGVFYFAGHGMQIKGRNYLIPVGAEIQREDEVAYAAIDAQAVLDKMESAGNGTNVMILDACRNNPFARSFRSAQQGLAQMDAPVGTLVAFATAPGSVASDGSGSHGLYTDHLLRAMREPGAKVEDVFKRVRAAVRKASAGKQVPWEATSLEGDLVLFPGRVEARPAAAPAPASAALPAHEVSMADAHERRTAELLAELAAAPARPAVGSGRPVKVAPRNAQGYAVGDRWNYQVIDRQRGEVVRNYALRVSRLLQDGGWMSGNDTEHDAHGRLVRWINPNGEKRSNAPHSMRWWPGMAVGERRRFDVLAAGEPADGGKRWTQRLESEARVLAIEDITVPAGTFRAWRVEHKGTATALEGHGFGRFTLTVWYAPELHTWVALEYRSDWNGAPSLHQREELTSLALVP